MINYRVFHSRTGAAALAAALLYLGDDSHKAFFDLASGLLDRRRFLLHQETPNETVLAVPSGSEPKALGQALTSLTKEFRPEMQISLFHCQQEPAHLTARLWLTRHHLVPGWLQRLWDDQLWRALKK